MHLDEEEEMQVVESEHGEPSGDELADCEERLCSVGAEQAAQRDFGELCGEDLKPKKIDFGHYIDQDQKKRKVHFKKLSLDRNMVCAFLLLICMNTKVGSCFHPMLLFCFAFGVRSNQNNPGLAGGELQEGHDESQFGGAHPSHVLDGYAYVYVHQPPPGLFFGPTNAVPPVTL